MERNESLISHRISTKRVGTAREGSLMRSFISVSVTAIGVLFWVSAAGASSPWLQEEGHLEASSGVIYESFDEFYRGSVRTDFPLGEFQQVTAVLSFEYGLLDNVNMDLSLGYVRAFGGVMTNDGLMDTTLGIKFRVLDEFAWDSPWVPSVAFRFGGIFKGTYEADGANFPGIPGDAASGFEGELAVGKLGLPLGVGLTGNLGVRAREKNVPIEWHLRVGAFKTFFDCVTLGLAYDQWSAISGLDIGGPGFSPDAFRELKEISKNIETSIGYSDPKGRYLGFYYVKNVGGRNTGIRDSFGFSLSAPFVLFEGE
jgi:hypothetical protein